MIHLRNFLKLLGLGGILGTVTRPVVAMKGSYDYNLGESVSITWAITKNILIPCIDSQGDTVYDTNSRGEYYQIIGEAVKFKKGTVPSKTAGMDLIIGNLRFESEIFILENLTDMFVNGFEQKLEKYIEEHPEAFGPIGRPNKVIRIE